MVLVRSMDGVTSPGGITLPDEELCAIKSHWWSLESNVIQCHWFKTECSKSNLELEQSFLFRAHYNIEHPREGDLCYWIRFEMLFRILYSKIDDRFPWASLTFQLIVLNLEKNSLSRSHSCSTYPKIMHFSAALSHFWSNESIPMQPSPSSLHRTSLWSK